MEIFEALLAKELSLITEKHNLLWNNSLYKIDNNENKPLPLAKHRFLKKGGFVNVKLTSNAKNRGFNAKKKNRRARNARSASNSLEPASIYMEQNEDIRTCQNMNGVLGNFDFQINYFLTFLLNFPCYSYNLHRYSIATNLIPFRRVKRFPFLEFCCRSLHLDC